jgi:hypothetical protein
MATMNILNFIRALGVQVGLDFDDELLIETPDSISRDTILATLKPYRTDLTQSLKAEGLFLRSYHFGGPLDGQPHAYSRWGNPYHAVHVARAKWAVYQVDRDQRALFRGYATSERKAKRGEYVAIDKTRK